MSAAACARVSSSSVSMGLLRGFSIGIAVAAWSGGSEGSPVGRFHGLAALAGLALASPTAVLACASSHFGLAVLSCAA
eukprot:3620174-Alexandrium_andersonii.AAC.1